jgi:hypothetical protein
MRTVLEPTGLSVSFTVYRLQIGWIMSATSAGDNSGPSMWAPSSAAPGELVASFMAHGAHKVRVALSRPGSDGG